MFGGLFLSASKELKAKGMDLFDYDPVTGASYYFDHDESSNKTYIRTEQDVKPLLDLNMAYRNEGIKKLPSGAMLRHYASVPMTVILEMRAKGIDFYDQNDARKVIQEIEANYPLLKVDNMRHGVK
jgi:hypothetical protein